MFSFFGKKEKVKIIDRVFISEKAKLNALLEKLQTTPDLSVITWFDEAYDTLKQQVSENNLSNAIFLSREISSHTTQNKTLIFFEHYPLATKEYELAEKLQMKEMIFYSSLDEQLYKYFGGDKIASLMEKLGLSENEAIQHTLISNSIKNAQEKIANKITVEHAARSQEEWFQKNLPLPH